MYNAAPSQMLPIIRTYAPDRIDLARWGFWPEAAGRARQLCPGNSDLDPLCNIEGIIDLHAEVAHGTFNAGMPEQKLHRA